MAKSSLYDLFGQTVQSPAPASLNCPTQQTKQSARSSCWYASVELLAKNVPGGHTPSQLDAGAVVE